MKARVMRPIGHQGKRREIGEIVEMNRDEFIRFSTFGLVELAFPFSWISEIPKVSIVTLLYNTTRAEFDRWVDTFKESTADEKAKIEVIMIENTGAEYPDGEYIRHKCRHEGFVYVKNDTNRGFSAGCNQGAALASGEVLIFLNDDLAFPERWLNEILNILIDKPQTAVVGAKLLRDGTGDYSEYERPNWVCGAVFAVRKHEFDRNGGFDESYFFMGEETDYCEIAHRLGYEIEQAPANIIHVGGETVEATSDFFKEHMERAKALYHQKFSKKNRIAASMLVGNEKGRYLEQTIAWLLPRVHVIVIVDDHSTDGTFEILQQLQKENRDKIKLYRHDVCMFARDEHLARESLHYKTLKEYPAFIMPIDADEMLSKNFDRVKNELIKGGQAYNFPIVHLWGDEHHRRVDSLWGRQSNIRFYKVDYSKSQDFYKSPLHCGSAPIYAYESKVDRNDVSLVHFGWIRHNDFLKKKKRNAVHDPNGVFEPIEHLHENPTLVEWVDDVGVKVSKT